MNGVIKETMKKVANENPESLDGWLPSILLVYRAKVHSSTGYLPYKLIFGNPMNWVLDADS